MPTLELRTIHKSYGAVRSLTDISLKFQGNDVVALLGDNGAGKSTLAKIMAGAVQCDGGEILLDGEAVSLTSPAVASAHGIEMVYQDLSLIDTLDIASNLHLGRELRRPGLLGWLGFLDKPQMRRTAATAIADVGSRIGSVRRPVEVLSGGQRQAVAIARAAARARGGAGVVILDEPTAALGVHQTDRVIALIRRLHEQGILVICITHHLPLCFEVATKLVILRHGQVAANLVPSETGLKEVVNYITGTAAEATAQ